MGVPAVNDGGAWYPATDERDQFRGATIRDVFACHAAASLVAAPGLSSDPYWIANTAYAVADAMIKRRMRDYATAAASSLGLPVDLPLDFDRPEPSR